MELTARQIEIAQLVAQGYSNKDVARATGLAVQTVKDHVCNAANRLPGDGRPRYKLMVWFFNLRDDAAA